MSTSTTPHSTYGRRSFLMLAGLLAACGSAPKPLPPTTVEMQFNADADVNPDVRGRASPLSVRVYALKSASAFESADFFTLFEKDQATLGAELLKREELLLLPGQSRSLSLKLSDEARVLAIMAAYRDLDRSHWRQVLTLKLNHAHTVLVKGTARQLKVEQKL